MNESEEQLSALMDGALKSEECADFFARLPVDARLQSLWGTYHLVGDVLRQPAHPVQAHDTEFVSRLRKRLAVEQVDRAGMVVTPSLTTLPNTPSTHLVKRSANDTRWRLVVGLASVLLMATVVWQGMPWGGISDGASGVRLAQQSAQPNAAAPPVMIRDPQLDALLAAQRQFSGTPTFRTPAGFLRNATFENGER